MASVVWSVTHHTQISELHASPSPGDVVFKHNMPVTVQVRLEKRHTSSDVPTKDVGPIKAQREAEAHYSSITVVVSNIIEEVATERR